MPLIPGEYFLASADIRLNEGLDKLEMLVTNSGDRPIQVGSHVHFFEANRALVFARHLAYGFRLDIPSGTSIRFEPGDTRQVNLVAYGGRRIMYGFGGLVNGELDANRSEAIRRAKERGYGWT